MTALRVRAVALCAVAACSGPASMGHDDAAVVDDDADVADAVAPACAIVGTADVVIGTAAAGEDHALEVTARSMSATRWDEAGNEALVLEVRGAQRGLIGHLVLHQGATDFAYSMSLGALAAGEDVLVRVSSLSAAMATSEACVAPAKLTPASALGAAAEGLVNAPIFRWPVQKRFDDLPVVLGWSGTRNAYQTVFTNENGGTVEICGGGAAGIQAEVARWGRASDIEGSYAYGGVSPRWERCDGTVPTTTTAVRLEGAHPILYYGDGHNRLYESRGGYGQACGSGAPEKADGNLAGWNVSNPGNELANDDGRTIILRPLPVAMDALGYAQFGGRREALADRYAPWVYRLTAHELAREGKIDNTKALPLSRYLYVDIRVADVGGSGDTYCSTPVTGGFKLRAFTSGGTMIDGPQITAGYASNGAHDYKRVALELPDGTVAADIDHFVFDAYDGDGIYVTAIADAFVPQPDGDNGASLTYVRMGIMPYAYYVDDNSGGCTAGVNTGGPGGTAYQCTGTLVTIPK